MTQKIIKNNTTHIIKTALNFRLQEQLFPTFSQNPDKKCGPYSYY